MRCEPMSMRATKDAAMDIVAEPAIKLNASKVFAMKCFICLPLFTFTELRKLRLSAAYDVWVAENL